MAQIAVTGAGGRVGEHVLPALEENHEVTPVNRSDVSGWETTIADVTNYEEMVDAFKGYSCVVHLAAQSASEAAWEAVFEPNIQGTWNVYRAAVANDVDRVVFASSNHVSHMYNMADPDEPRSQKPPTESIPVTADDAARPSGPYGITKVTGEAIGSYYADRFDIEVVNLRIGWVLSREALQEHQTTDISQYARAMWLSPQDCREGIRKSVREDISENPLTVNLLSENEERYLSLTKTMRCLDYRPSDDSSLVVRD